MIRITPQQIALLESVDEDGFVTRPNAMKAAIANKIAIKLIEQKLVRDIRAKATSPIWREDENGRTFSLKVLKAGREALRAGFSVDAALSRPTPDSTSVGNAQATKIEDTVSGLGTSEVGVDIAVAERPGTKRSVILALMRRDSGATIEDLIKATGWLPHTTRAALTGLRKQGIAVERQKDVGGGPSVYRVLPAPTSVAA